MITAEFFFGNDGLINGFSLSGHSGSAPKGEDIICSAVSSPAYMTVNTLTEIMALNPEVIENDGLMTVKLNSVDAAKAADILNGLRLHIEELEKMYPEYIKVERGAYNA